MCTGVVSGDYLPHDICVKIYFTIKARFVAEGHHMEPPESFTYSYLVSRYCALLFLLLVVINGVGALSGLVLEFSL